MKPEKKNWPKILVILGITFLLALGLVIIGFSLWQKAKPENQVDSNVIAIVNGEKITKSDFNAKVYSQEFAGTLSDPRETSESEKVKFLNELVEEKIAAIEAAKNNVKISEAEAIKIAAERGVNINEMSGDQITVALKNLLSSLIKEKVRQKVEIVKTGEYVLFRFDKYYKYGPIDIKGEGEQSKIDTQKAYAKRLADKTYTDIKSGKITFKQAVARVNSDPVISGKAFEPLRANIFGDFGDIEYTERLSYFDEKSYSGFLEAVSKLKADGISEPILVKGYPSDTTQGDMSDIFYAIVKVDKVTGGEIPSIDGNYYNWLESKKKKYRTEIYYQNVGAKKENVKYGYNLISNAYASTVYGCDMPISGTHRTIIQTYSYRLTASGTLDRYSNSKINVSAGDNTTLRGNGSCGAAAFVDGFTKEAPDQGSYDGVMRSSYEYSTTGTYYYPYVIDCDRTGWANITFYSNSPVIINNLTNYDDWDFITSGYNHYGIVGQTYDSKWLHFDHPSGYVEYFATTMYLRLDLGVSGSWANGTVVIKRGLYKPHYENKPTASIVAGTPNVFNIPTGSTFSTVNVTGIYNDQDRDPYAYPSATRNPDGVYGRLRIQRDDGSGFINVLTTSYRGLGNPPPAGVTRIYSETNPVLTAGNYRMYAEAEDEHGWTGISAPFYFTIKEALPPDLSCNIYPQSSYVPANVDGVATPQNGAVFTNYDWEMNNVGNTEASFPAVATLMGKGSNITYTYNIEGTYNVWVRGNLASGGTVIRPCGSGVVVKNPTGKTGGEVAP